LVDARREFGILVDEALGLFSGGGCDNAGTSALKASRCITAFVKRKRAEHARSKQ